MKYLCFGVLLFFLPVFAEDIPDAFQKPVRESEALTPEQELASFRLPPGFEIQLVASEPSLRKPMNMQWDSVGRLWVTESREYPYAVTDGKAGRDTITVFSDFAPNGKARKVEVFADGLNVPIGVYPFCSATTPSTKPTWKCIVWSIPNIWLMEDTDGDGKADKRESLYGPLGWQNDVHGNLASFRRGCDGWLYGTHGYSNNTHMNGKDGSKLHMHSGNTWRAKIDGSRVEGNTWGMVNPFGMCWDERGNLFSTDCHSSPKNEAVVYQLLKGGYYRSFDKTHDGLGFSPNTLEHEYEGSALCGSVYLNDPSWPAEYRDRILAGNVFSSRVNQDQIEWRGASSKGKRMPDFIKTDDPWFRPVDMNWGPDGALYVSDFYNKIIGHYEVPLEHPGRDRERGRIWRVVYKGPNAKPLLSPALAFELTALIKELASTNPTRRMLALHAICDQFGTSALIPLKGALAKPVNAFQKLGAMWALHRLGGLTEGTLLAAIQDKEPLVRIHAVRMAGEIPAWSSSLSPAIHAANSDSNPFVRRCAAEALAAHPTPENVPVLLALLAATSKEDDHLIHSTRIALRDQLRHQSAVSLSPDAIRKEDLKTLLDIMLAVPGEQTALLRFSIFERMEVAPELLMQQLPSLVKNIPMERMDSLVAMARKNLNYDRGGQANLIIAVLDALAQRGAQPTVAMKEWGNEVVAALMAVDDTQSGWTSYALAGHTGRNPWDLQKRKNADGAELTLISSHPHGAHNTGILRSPVFIAPDKLRFVICGHDGYPGGERGKKNYIQLRESGNHRVLKEAQVPRSDVASATEWDLADAKGTSVYIEVTDTDAGYPYSWLGFGNFEPPLPELETKLGATHRKALAADVARGLELTAEVPKFAKLMDNSLLDPDTRVRAARALAVLSPELISKMEALLNETTISAVLKEHLAMQLGAVQSRDANMVLVNSIKGAPHQLQLRYAVALSASVTGAQALLKACEDGFAAPSLFRDKALTDRLKALNNSEVISRMDKFSASLPPANEQIEKLIEGKRKSFESSRPDVNKGSEVFSRHCATCHNIDDRGGIIGPQLNEVAGRGPTRLLEDILDPNRNVDRAFRLTLMTKKDGSVLSGLFRREEGAQLIFSDLAGQEFSVTKADVTKREETETSLMPSSFGEAITDAELNDLLSFLLVKRGAKLH